MEISIPTGLLDVVDGVYPAQKRNSANSQAILIQAGITAMQYKRFDEIAIPELVKSCGISVGAFYARFRDKDAYFRALQAQTLHEHKLLISQKFNNAELSQLEPKAVIHRAIEILLAIFNSPYRGVLRESYMRSQGSFDYWAEMRAKWRKKRMRRLKRKRRKMRARSK